MWALLVAAQFAAQDLAHVGLGQFVAELDVFGALVTGQVVVAEAGHGFLGQQRVVAHHKHCLLYTSPSPRD